MWEKQLVVSVAEISVVCAVSDAGVFVPSLLLFPRKRTVPSLLNGASAGSEAFCSSKEWNDSTIFKNWLRHFAVIKSSKNNFYLLLPVNFARENANYYHVTFLQL